jgi:hypothetical protein
MIEVKRSPPGVGKKFVAAAKQARRFRGFVAKQ